MRVMVSGGGTGGHIYPAITIIERLRAQDPSVEILYVGTKKGLESDIIPKENIPFETIEVAGFQRKLTLANLAIAGRAAKGVWQALSLVRKFRPDVVIGTGGYVCGPVLLAAGMLGIPTMIQEQNVVPGMTNKIASRFAAKIAVGYEEAGKYFPDREKIVATGNPIRAAVMSARREDGLAEFGLDGNKKTILVSGGSRGARSINTALIALHEKFRHRDDVQILHITGQNEYNRVIDSLKEKGIDIGSAGNIKIVPYAYHMPNALAAADLAIFRAGALGLAELAARGIPSVLVPYPYATANHQEYNARIVEKHGAAVVIKDSELTGELLLAKVEALLAEPNTLAKMATASLELGRAEAADDIARLARTLAKQG